jgi:hypothetical protein
MAKKAPAAVQKNLIRNLIGVLVFLSNRPMSIRLSGCRSAPHSPPLPTSLPSLRYCRVLRDLSSLT